LPLCEHVLVAGRMRAFPHGHLSNDILLDTRLVPLLATFLSCTGLAVSVLRSRSSESQRPAHLGAQHPAARAMARGKLVKALAAAALLALSVYTELAFAERKSALVRAALIRPAVRRPSRFRAKTVLTDRASQAYAAALSTLSAFLPPSTRLCLRTRATAIILVLLGRTCTGKSGRSSGTPCTCWERARGADLWENSRCVSSLASACRCSSHSSMLRRTLRCVACCVLRVSAECRHAEPVLGGGQTRTGQYMHAARVLVPIPLRLADRAAQRPPKASILSPLTFTFVSPLIARGGPLAARGREPGQNPHPRGVPRARCVYLSCVCDRV
jgi:hypothetical protein